MAVDGPHTWQLLWLIFLNVKQRNLIVNKDAKDVLKVGYAQNLLKTDLRRSLIGLLLNIGRGKVKIMIISHRLIMIGTEEIHKHLMRNRYVKDVLSWVNLAGENF